MTKVIDKNTTNLIFKIIEINRSNKDNYEKLIETIVLLDDIDNIITISEILLYIFKDAEIIQDEVVKH